MTEHSEVLAELQGPGPGIDGSRPSPLLVTVDTAAKMLSIGRTSLYQLMGKGEIAFLQLGACRRIPVSELERWIADRLRRGF
jgi:excisionase family DNA binding protein